MEQSAAGHRLFMRRAVALARRGFGRVSPNPPVGCVLVNNGEIVGEGFHIHDEKEHAEVRAVRAAGARAAGATAYVTLEPCCHHGRTPPCADLLIRARIRSAVIPMLDPNPRVDGRGVERLRAAGINVELVQDSAAAELVEMFACHMRRQVPLVVAKAAMTLDGRIAIRSGVRTDISSAGGRAFAQDLRLQMDAVLVGAGTVAADNPELTYRGPRPRSRPLLRVILDGRLRTPLSARLFDVRPAAPVLLFCTQGANPRRRKELESRGAEVKEIQRGPGGLDLQSVLAALGCRGVQGLLVEGGATVHWSFLAAGCVDKFYFMLAPLVLGGERALPVVGGKGYTSLQEAARFKLRRRISRGADLILEAFPQGSHSILSPWLR